MGADSGELTHTLVYIQFRWMVPICLDGDVRERGCVPRQGKESHVDFGSNFWDILLWTVWIFLFMAFLMVLFNVFGDLYGDKDVSGWGKFWWTIFIIFLPFLGLLVYLIARGQGMAERKMAKLGEMQAAQNAYIKQVAGTANSATDQIASAKALLDSGAITQDEFASLKAKALAG